MARNFWASLTSAWRLIHSFWTTKLYLKLAYGHCLILIPGFSWATRVKTFSAYHQHISRSKLYDCTFDVSIRIVLSWLSDGPAPSSNDTDSNGSGKMWWCEAYSCDDQSQPTITVSPTSVLSVTRRYRWPVLVCSMMICKNSWDSGEANALTQVIVLIL